MIIQNYFESINLSNLILGYLSLGADVLCQEINWLSPAVADPDGAPQQRLLQVKLVLVLQDNVLIFINILIGT